MINSISSRLIASITTIRNPQGKEDNWLKNAQNFYKLPSGKVRFAAETAYALTTITALIETCVSGTFLILSIPIALINPKPLKKSIQWFKSSAFSIFWSVAYLHLNLKFPNLLTKEDLSRNFVFRSDIENTNNWKKAPLRSRLFMMPKEMPVYLSTAYALRFKDFQLENGRLARFSGKIKRYKQLIKEILRMGGSKAVFKNNINRLDTDFEQLNNELPKTKRALCAYFVSSEDHNGAILGDPVYYYHHYKIKRLEKYFDVSAKVVRTADEMFKHLNDLKAAYPDRPIQLVDIVAHGSSQSIVIKSSSQNKEDVYDNDHVGKDEFSACAEDADIILDACSTGAGDNSIGKLIGEKNPGKRVYAPGSALFFSKPVFKIRNGVTKVDHVTHGFAIVNAYTSKEFQVT